MTLDNYVASESKKCGGIWDLGVSHIDNLYDRLNTWAFEQFSYLFLDEIATQLTDSGAKLLFGHARANPILQKAVALSNKNIKIIYLKDSASESIPADGINYSDLDNPTGDLWNGIQKFPLKIPKNCRSQFERFDGIYEDRKWHSFTTLLFRNDGKM